MTTPASTPPASSPVSRPAAGSWLRRLTERLGSWLVRRLAPHELERAIDDAARAEIERVAEVRIRQLEIREHGTLEMRLAEGNEVLHAIACAAEAMFESANAPNYLEMQFRTPRTGELLVLHLQRYAGKTPNQLQRAAEARADAAEAALAALRASLGDPGVRTLEPGA